MSEKFDMRFSRTTRRFAGAAAAIAATATLLIAGSPGAGADPGQDEAGVTAVMQIQHATTRNCLADTDREVGLATCAKTGDLERWDNYTAGKFRNVATGLCLGANGASLFTISCSSASAVWSTTPFEPPKYIVHKPTGNEED